MLDLNELLKNPKKVKNLPKKQREEVEKLLSSVKKDENKNKEDTKND